QIELRLALFGAGGREFTSATSTTIIADGLWHSYSFSLAESALTSVGSNSNYSGMITGVTNFQFRHNPGAATGSGTLPNFTGIMGMDNVHAVPEPASLLAVCLGGLIIKRRRASAP
ncbi:MAG: PEP-CTERM sorting domain-containing protein, partial [Fimbriimonadaceae bacterium]